MRRLLFFATALLLPLLVMSQPKKIALLETLNGDKSVQVKGIELNMVRGELRKAVSNQAGFQAFTRTDIDQLMKEYGFQKSGMVSDAQRKRLGEMSGADYICVSTLTKSNTEFYLEAYLIDVESGEISNPASQFGILRDGTYTNLFQLCQDLAQELIGYISPNVNHGTKKPGPTGSVARGQAYTETAFGMEMSMVYVEGSSFNMGCTSEQFDCDNDEMNVRRVTLDGYYIGATEVTQAQWEAVMGTGVYQQRQKHYGNDEWAKIHGNGDNYPMYYVTWEEAMVFCRRLSEETGKTYTLPSEAQWEYAARGGKNSEKTQFAGSNMIDLVCWYGDNGGGTIHPVARKNPNALGLYDMSGNVWELCYDWFNSTYPNDNTRNPVCNTQETNDGYISRVERGGCFWSTPRSCRVANRGEIHPETAASFTGFRVVMIP